MSAHYRSFWRLREWAREEGLQSFAFTEKAFFLRVLLMSRLRVCISKHPDKCFTFVKCVLMLQKCNAFLKKLYGSHASGRDFLSHRDLLFLVQGRQLHAHGIAVWIHQPSHGVVLWWWNLHGCHEASRWGIQQVLHDYGRAKYEFNNASLCCRIEFAHGGWKLVALDLVKEIHAYAQSHALKILVVVITLHILMHIILLLLFLCSYDSRF